MIRSLLSLPLCLLFVGLLLLAAPPNAVADPTDDYINAQMVQRHIPGMAVAIIRDGKTVKLQGYGLADVERRTPATADTVYEIGSLTKQFTATALMMLVEQGKVGLDDPITRDLPGLPEAWDKVTVRNLLTHTSGIPNYTDQPAFRTTMFQDVTHTQVIATVSGLPLDFTPGAKYAYSNTNYFLLGMLIEKATGESYGQFLQQRIFGPLGMTATQVNDLWQTIPHRAVGYSGGGDKPLRVPAISMAWPFAAGVLVSTVADLARWDAAQGSSRLLKAESWRQMWTPPTLPGGAHSFYGFGWIIQNTRGHQIIWHNGGIPGFSANNTRLIADRMTVIVLLNTDSVSADEIARGLVLRYVPALAPPETAAIPDDPKVTALLKSVLRDTAAGTIDPTLFTPQYRAQLFPAAMAQLGKNLAALGPLTSLMLTAQQASHGRRIYRYRAVFGATPTACLFGLSKDGKIDTLGVAPE